MQQILTFKESSEAPPPAQASNGAVLTMSSLGKLGRFGNQLMQYAFLRICAERGGAQPQCPPWIGQGLFGLNDPPISEQLPPAIEHSPDRENMFDALPELIPYIEKLTQCKSCRIGHEALDVGAKNVDLWGFFQLHTRFLRPHRDFIRSLFRPTPEIEGVVRNGYERLKTKGKTIIGIHIRKGDFVELPLFGFTYPVPPQWWCEWLESIWRKVEDPALFICSDDIDSVRPAFAKFNPITSRELNLSLPEAARGGEFYPDFYFLTQCDLVGISNSTFSFFAALLNDNAQRCVRPHWDFSTRFVEFDPWNSEQLLYYGNGRGKLFKSFSEAMQVAWNTDGLQGLLQCCRIYPRERIKMKLNRAKYAYAANGTRSALRTLIHRLPV